MRKVQLAVFILVPLVNYIPFAFLEQPFDRNPDVLIQPAGYAFSIWAAIFIGMIVFSVFQLKMERAASKHMETATWAAISAGLASIVFVPISYTNLQWLGTVDILWHLISLIVLFRALYQQIKLEVDPKTHWYYIGPQLYLGWISAATAVSIALTLREAGVAFDLVTEIYITAGVMVVLISAAIWLATRGGQWVSLTIVWALVGLIVKNGMYTPILYTAIIGIVLVVGIVVYTFVKGRKLFDQQDSEPRLSAI